MLRRCLEGRNTSFRRERPPFACALSKKCHSQCPQSVKEVSCTLWEHSQDSSWTLQSPEIKGLGDTPSDTPVLGGHSPGHLGPRPERPPVSEQLEWRHLFYKRRPKSSKNKTWWTFRIFFIFCLLGEGEGGV